MRCHDQGMKGFTDAVRSAVQRLPGSAGLDRRQVLRLYPEPHEMEDLLKEDTERFGAALARALGKPQGREPLTPVSQRFLDAPLQLPAAAAELGLPEPGGLKEVFRAPQFAALGLVPLASEGVVRRDMWEDYYDQVVRQLGLGVPVVPVDGLTRRDFQAIPAPFEVELRTNKKNNLFEPGDELVILVTNRSARDIHVELIGSSARGQKTVLVPSSTLVRAGQEVRYPPEGQGIRIRGGLGKEQVTLFAGEAEFPAGEVLRGQGVTDRVVHPFYGLDRTGRRVRLSFDPARLVKKTIDIETR
jgi:hypothetical protein